MLAGNHTLRGEVCALSALSALSRLLAFPPRCACDPGRPISSPKKALQVAFHEHDLAKVSVVKGTAFRPATVETKNSGLWRAAFGQEPCPQGLLKADRLSGHMYGLKAVPFTSSQHRLFRSLFGRAPARKLALFLASSATPTKPPSRSP
jgi:hypothetical protein